MLLRKVSLLWLLCFMAAGLALHAAPEKQMSVKVKETQVRSKPSFMGKVLARLSYGDRVDVLEEKRGWANVVIPGSEDKGWVNLSALTTKRVVLKAGASDVDKSASSGEVALAGKGFNEEVEAKYKQDSDLDYTWVDKMEEFRYPVDNLVAFMVEGGLNPSEGGE